ncbi:MAG TPA: heme-copper oxidase subunit III [Candidatus Methylomirabilis sp.]
MPVLDAVREELTRVPPALPPEGDEGPRPPRPAGEPAVGNARLGMLVFLAFEAMFFAGLLGAYLVFRLGATAWPPPGEPYLPIGVTWVNTGILLFSSYTVRRAGRAIRQDDRQAFARWLLLTALYGVTFLAVQGYEWVRLVRFGLSVSGTYGSTFYTLIGTHALHVLGAVLWLLVVLALARRGRFSARRHAGIQVFGMYWHFVVGLWVVLFGLVYLA